MKKILFAVLAIAFSAVAYSAQCNWAFSAEGYDPFPTAQYFTISGDISGYITTLTTDGQGYDAFVNSLTAGTYSQGVLDNYGSASGLFENVGTYLSVIVFDGTAAGSTFYYQTLSTDGYTYESPNGSPGDLAFWALDDEGNLDMTSGTIAAVPEPTVLALLALGVAGLALKRKVA